MQREGSDRRPPDGHSIAAGSALLAASVFLSCAPAAARQVAAIEEAAQINGGLALQLCLAQGVDGPQTAAMFRQAGFAEEVQRSSVNSDTTHYFTGPSESARAEVYYGETPSNCIVYSDHMGVTTASYVLEQIAPRVYPGFVRRVIQWPVDPAIGQPAQCVSYEEPTNPIGLAISVLPSGGAQGCFDDGTSQFSIYYRA